MISPGGAAVGLARKMMKDEKKRVVLFAPMYSQEVVAGVPNLAGGKSLAKALHDLVQFVNTAKIDFIIIDMIEQFPRPILFEGKTIKTYGDIAVWLANRGLIGMGVFPAANIAEQLEFERETGCDMAAAVGLHVPETVKFDSIAEGIKFLQAKENKQRIWVFKPNDNKFATYVPDTTEELIFHMTTLQQFAGDKLSFVLQEKVSGTEVDIEGWFKDGEYIPGTTNITLETKTLMTGNFGLAVGCATTVQKAISEDSYLFRHALKPYFPLLRKWKYTGTFSVTCIVDKQKRIYFLENCVRMGWDATYALMELWDGTVYDFFLSIINGVPIKLKSGWGYGVRVTLPPYPIEATDPEEKEALRIIKKRFLKHTYIYGERKASQFGHVWWNDVVETDYRINNEPVFQVIDEEPCVVTAYHETSPYQAEKLAHHAVDALVCPNLQVRIGDGAHSAYQRFMSLVDRGVIITEEKRLRRIQPTEVIGDEQTASD